MSDGVQIFCSAELFLWVTDSHGIWIHHNGLHLSGEKPEHKLTVNAKALKLLDQISQPVVVVAIAGLYWTGKVLRDELPAGVGEAPVEMWGTGGLLWGWGHWQQQSWKVPCGASPKLNYIF